MKRNISLLLAILMLVALIPNTFAQGETVEAKKANQKMTLDGKEVEAPFYNINGSNYIKLRDFAVILNETEKKFNVSYDNEKKTFIIERSRSYEKMEGDLEEIKNEKEKALLSYKDVYINYNPKGSEIYEIKEAKTALINGNNYLQLRDLGELVGIYVDYDKETRTIKLSTDYKDDTYEGFLRKTFTDEEEKVFASIESFYNSLAKNDKEGINKFIKERINPNSTDENSAEFETNLRNTLGSVGINDIKEGYKVEKVLENYDDGKGYLVAFNYSDSYVAIEYFVPENKESTIEIALLGNSGSDYSNGSLDSYFEFLNLNEGLKMATVFSLHDNFVKKEYDAAFINYQNLGLKGDKEEMMKFLNEKAVDHDIYHPNYTYRVTEHRTYSGRSVSYRFDYGTGDQVEFTYYLGSVPILQVVPIKGN